MEELGGFWIVEEIAEYTNAQELVRVKLIKLEINEIVSVNIAWDEANFIAGEFNDPTLVELPVLNDFADTGVVPSTGDFSISNHTVTGLVVAPTNIRLSLGEDITVGESITVSYTPGANPVTGLSTGTLAPALSNVSATNVLTYTYLLDEFATGAAAYSLRKVFAGGVYSVQVRLVNGTTTNVLLDDVGSLTLNSLVSAGGTLGAWAGSSDVRVQTVYDQIGGRDLTTTVWAEMPRLIDAGVLHTKGGLAAMRFEGGQVLEYSAGLPALDNGK